MVADLHNGSTQQPPSSRAACPDPDGRPRHDGIAVRTPLLIAVAVLLLAAACSGDGGDSADDVVAFCETLESSSEIDADGLSIDPAAFDELVELAPSEISDAVGTLANTLRSAEEIGDEDLAALFAALFDPDARGARQELHSYARTTCLIDVSSGELAALQCWLDENFPTQRWKDGLVVDVELDEGGVAGISAQVAGTPLGDDVIDACEALSVYLYSEREGTGAVTIEQGGRVLASRLGPEARCQRP